MAARGQVGKAPATSAAPDLESDKAHNIVSFL